MSTTEITLAEASRRFDVPLSTLDSWRKRGWLDSRRAGSRRLVRVDQMQRLVAARAAASARPSVYSVTSDKWMATSEVAAATGYSYSYTRNELQRLVDAGQLICRKRPRRPGERGGRKWEYKRPGVEGRK